MAPKQLPDDFSELIECLNKHRVRYLWVVYALCLSAVGCGGPRDHLGTTSPWPAEQPVGQPADNGLAETTEPPLPSGLSWIEGTDTPEISHSLRFLVGGDPIEVEPGGAGNLGHLEPGPHWVSLDQPGYWAESNWLVVEPGVAPRLRRRIYALGKTCATEHQACFTMDTRTQPKLRIGYRDIDSWDTWDIVERDEGHETTELIEQVWFARDYAEGGTTKGADILVGPGTTEAQLELAIALAGRARLAPLRLKLGRPTVDDSSGPVAPTIRLELELGEATSALRLPLEMIGPQLATCYQGVELTQRLRARLRFDASRAPTSVEVGTGLPEPPPPDCMEYEEYEGRCSRDPLPHPDYLVDAKLLDCLRDALRGVRTVPGTEPANYEFYLLASEAGR
jgi:hypothetical protein